MRSGKLWKAAALVAVVLMMAVAVGPAIDAEAQPAESGVVMRGDDGYLGYSYWSGNHLAMTFDLERFCSSPAAPLGPELMLVLAPSGTVLEFVRADVPVSVYDYPGDDGSPGAGFAWMISQCGDIPDPVATGVVDLQRKIRVDGKGVVHGQNRLVGEVTTADGSAAQLLTQARFSFEAATGDLIALTQLEVRYSG